MLLLLLPPLQLLIPILFCHCIVVIIIIIIDIVIVYCYCDCYCNINVTIITIIILLLLLKSILLLLLLYMLTKYPGNKCLCSKRHIVFPRTTILYYYWTIVLFCTTLLTITNPLCMRLRRHMTVYPCRWWYPRTTILFCTISFYIVLLYYYVSLLMPLWMFSLGR